MANLLVTRFPNGVTNVGEDSPFADLTMPAPTKFHTYYEDFDYYVAANWKSTSAISPEAVAFIVDRKI